MPDMKEVERQIAANKAALANGPRVQPAAPMELSVSDLTEDELHDLTAAGRIVDGKVLAPAKVKPTPEEATTLDPQDIPEMPAGVAERMVKVAKLESSFSDQSPTGKKVESAGGVKEDTKPTNPDWAGKEEEPPIEFDDKMRFLATLLGAEHFSKTYQLFGGKLLVTFRTRTAHEEAIAANQAWADEKIDSQQGTVEERKEVRMLRIFAYRFAMSLSGMQVAGDILKPYDYSKLPARDDARISSVRVALDDLHRNLPGPLLVAMRNAHNDFEVLVARMTRAAGDESFWKAASAT